MRSRKSMTAFIHAGIRYNPDGSYQNLNPIHTCFHACTSHLKSTRWSRSGLAKTSDMPACLSVCLPACLSFCLAFYLSLSCFRDEDGALLFTRFAYRSQSRQMIYRPFKMACIESPLQNIRVFGRPERAL